MEIKSSKPATIADVKEIIGKRSKDGELGYEQSQSLEHAERFADDSEKVAMRIEKITENKKITREIATKIVDVCPQSISTLKAILAKDKIEVSEEEAAQIIKDLA